MKFLGASFSTQSLLNRRHIRTCIFGNIKCTKTTQIASDTCK